ncbi:MAG: phage tail tape measure C-terminal domain-containing protein [Burkholderiaceae bacterium]
MANIARLGVLLGLDSAEFQKGMAAASYHLEKFAKGAEKFGKIGAVAMVAAATAATRYADELADVAEANEVALGTVIGLSNALANSGGKSDNAGKMLSGMTKAIDAAADGSIKAQKVFDRVGVSLGDLSSLGAEDLFGKTIEGLSKIDDPIQRNAAAMELFGKAAKGVDFKNLHAGMRTGSALAAEQEKAIKDAADAYDLMGQTAREVSLVIAASIGPALKGLAEYMREFKSETSLVGDVFKTVFETVVILAANVEFAISGVIRTLKYLANLTPEGQAQYRASDAIAVKRLADFEARIMGAKAATFGMNTGGIGEGSAGPSAGVVRDIKDPFADEISKRMAAIGLIGQQIKFEQLRLQLAVDRNQLDAQTADLRAEAIALSEKLAEIDKKRASDIAAQAEKNPKVIAAIQQEADLSKRLAQDQSKTRIAGIHAAHEAQMRAYATERQAGQVAAIEVQMGIDERHAAEQAANQISLNEAQRMDRVALERAGKLFDLELAGKNLRQEDLQLRRDIFNIEQDLAAEIERINRLNVEGSEQAIASAKELAALHTAQVQKQYQSKNGTAQEGFFGAAEKFFNEMPTAMQQGAMAFDAVMSNMDTALSNFVRNGKLNFKDLARSVIQDLLLIQMRSQMTGLFKMALSAFSPAGSLGATPGFAGIGASPYADGGNPEVGKLALVGERGPELFIPRTAGTIIPNHQLGGMGGTTNVTNNYINAIDTKSFEDRLYGSSNAIWAANQYANKSLATNRGRA